MIGSYFQDPRNDTGAVNDGAHPVNGPYTSFIGVQSSGGSDYSLRWSGLFGSSWAVALQGAVHQEKNNVDPGLPGGNEIQYVNTIDNVQEGGFGLIQDKSFKRYLAATSITKYIGNNELKGGFEFMKDQADVVKRMSGDAASNQAQQVTIYPNPGDPSRPVYSHFYWTIPTASLPDNVPTSQLNATPFHETFSFYLQDTLTLLPNLTINLGLRYDNQQIFSGDGTRQINITDSWAPRFGFIWDPTKDNRTKVFGSFGYFYEQIPMDLVIRSYSSERQPTIYNFDPVSLVPDVTAAEIVGDSGAVAQGGGKIFGGFNDLTDARLSGQYLREGIFGVEREIVPSLAVGRATSTATCRGSSRTTSAPRTATTASAIPTEGRMANLFALDYNTQFPAPKAQRIYRGVQVDVTKQFSDNWTLLASYVYATLKGNYDGLFAPYTQPRGTADPNISALYDYYDFFTRGPVVDGVPQPVTASGDLSNDRRASQAVRRLRHALQPLDRPRRPTTRPERRSRASASRTPTPVRSSSSSARGSEGRVQSSYDADLHLGYPLQLGPVTLNFLVGHLQHPQHAARRSPWTSGTTCRSSRTPTTSAAALREAPTKASATRRTGRRSRERCRRRCGSGRSWGSETGKQYAVSGRQEATPPLRYWGSVAAKKSPRAAATAPGRSIGVRCPAPGIVTSRAPGMASAMASESAGGVSASCAPTTTSVGTAIDGEPRPGVGPIAHGGEVRFDGLAASAAG